jgi:hypothetical protein
MMLDTGYGIKRKGPHGGSPRLIPDGFPEPSSHALDDFFLQL